MTHLFLHLVNMSITAGWIVLAVLLLRLGLKKAPRWITCLLWGLVGLRLLLPFTIESPVSLIPSAQTISNDIVSSETPSIHSGVPLIDKTVNEVLEDAVPPDPPKVTTSDGSEQTSNDIQSDAVVEQPPLMERVISAAAWIWLTGMVGMLLYTVISVLRVKHRVMDGVLLRENIWQSDRIQSPFILGLFRPRIYVPYGLDDGTLEQVLSHERSHLRRRDHWVKPFAFVLLAIYWFNPLLWVAYILLCRDIEVACDQRVLRGLSDAERRQYAMALLQCGVERRTIAACPLAFGEVGIKQRIKSALHYRKPLLWVIIVSLLVCLVATVCLLTMPEEQPLQVISSREVEPDQVRTFHGTDTDGSIISDGLMWLWTHAENPDDNKDVTNVPLVISHSKDDLDQLMDALSDPKLYVDMRDWFKLDKYDDSYFEDKAILWLYLPGYNLGRYDYTVTLEETNKGLCYATALQYYSTSMFDPSPDRCQYLLLFEVERKNIENVDAFFTRHERKPIIVPDESKELLHHSVGSADLDGDGEKEILRVMHSADSMDDAFLVACKSDGTAILREGFHYQYHSQCYLVPQEDGSSRLLFIEADKTDSSYAVESFGLISLKDGERVVLDSRLDGRVHDITYFQDVISYAESLSVPMENAQLLFECVDNDVYYGDELGDTPRYSPMWWLDEYREKKSDTIQDVCENILTEYQAEPMAKAELDMDGDSKKESVSVLRYSSDYYDYPRFVLVWRNSDEAILSSYYIYAYLGVEDLDHHVYFYSHTDENGQDKLQMLNITGSNYYVYDMLISGKEDATTMTSSEWLAYREKTEAKLLFYIQGSELYFADEDPSDDYLKVDTLPDDTSYDMSIVAYNEFLKGRRLAYEFGDFDTSFSISDLYMDVNTSGIRNYALADVTKDGVPELLTQGYGFNVFSYKQGRVVHLHESPAGLMTRLLSNGALWAERTGGGNQYVYTTFFEIGSSRSVTFGDPGYDSDKEEYFVDDEWMNKAEFDASTKKYFEYAETSADLTWYSYADKSKVA